MTDLDLQLNVEIAEILTEGDEAPVLSEEGSAFNHQVHTDLPYWVLDPIDGTKNLTSGLPLGAVSIAHVSRRSVSAAGIWSSLWGASMFTWRVAEEVTALRSLFAPPIVGIDLDHADPMYRRAAIGAAEEVSSHIGAVRVLGSTATALAAVARGSLDAYLKLKSPLWDYAGGVGLVERQGASVDRPCS